MSAGPMCVQCLDDWDRDGQSYQGMQVHVTVVVGGDSMCVKHYRLWRDRNDVPAPKTLMEVFDPKGHPFTQQGQTTAREMADGLCSTCHNYERDHS